MEDLALKKLRASLILLHATMRMTVCGELYRSQRYAMPDDLGSYSYAFVYGTTGIVDLNRLLDLIFVDGGELDRCNIANELKRELYAIHTPPTINYGIAIDGKIYVMEDSTQYFRMLTEIIKFIA